MRFFAALLFATLLSYFQTPCAFAANKIDPDTYIVTDMFPLNGAFVGTKWNQEEFGNQPNCWGSFGGALGNDKNNGTLESPEFKLHAKLSTFISGYPNTNGNSLALYDKATNETLDLKVNIDPGEKWQFIRWKIPQEWRSRRVTLRAIDRSVDSNGWFGICEILPAIYKFHRPSPDFRPAITLVREMLWHFLWLAIPSATLLALLFLKVSGIPERLLLPCFLVCSGIIAYLVFWLYFLHSPIGGFGSIAAILIAVGLLSRKDIRGLLFSRTWYVELWGPLLGTLGVAIFFLSINYLYGGLKYPLLTSSNRFLTALPVDNILPWQFAQILAENQPVRPFCDIWNTSDRPPLQTAYVLMQYPLMQSELNYQLLGTFLQTFLIAAIWSLGRAFKVSRGAQNLVLGFAVFSGTTLLHSVFIWPKLLSAAFLLCAVCFFVVRKEFSSSLWAAIFIAASLAFGLLSHGASLFGVFAIGSIFLIWNRPPLKFLFQAALGALLLYVPWVCYQRFYDPPGDRLIKWHIAGTRAEDGVPAVDSIVSSYQQLSWAEIFDYKLQNVSTLFEGYARFFTRLFSKSELVSYWHRQDCFFYFFYALDLLLLGFVAYLILVAKNRKDERLQPVHFSFCLGIVGMFWWCLLMFGPGTTILHQGTFLISSVVNFALATSLYYLSPSISLIVLVLQAVRWLFAWVFSPFFLPGGSTFVYNSPDLDPGMLILMAASFDVCVLLFPTLKAQRS